MAGREWDTRVVWNVRHGRWWWNAWRKASGTELWGFTDSPEDALRAMTVAIRGAGSGSAPTGAAQTRGSAGSVDDQ